MEEKEIKGRNDYKWHPKLTKTQKDELWAEGIVPGLPEYRMGLRNFGIRYEIEENENNFSEELEDGGDENNSSEELEDEGDENNSSKALEEKNQKLSELQRRIQAMGMKNYRELYNDLPEEIAEKIKNGITTLSDEEIAEVFSKVEEMEEKIKKEESQTSDEIKVDLDINKKTGACKITSKDFEMQIEMNAADYSRKGLKQFRQDLLNVEEIAKEDQKYIKNIDPTIYKAYLNYDLEKGDTKAPSVAKMYVDGVIKKSKALDKGKINEEVQMPGKINVDIGWHPKMKNAREKTQKFRKIRDFVGNFRANKILKKHGAPGIMAWKKLNVANIVDNRRAIRSLMLGISGIAMLGTAANVEMNSREESQNSTRQQIEVQGPMQQKNANFDKDIEENNYENESIDTNSEKQESQKSEKEKKVEFSKEKKNRIYPGDVISAEQYTATFGSADAKEASGALNTKGMLGVNKIACVIDGKTYSSVNYSINEVYEMAKKAGVEVKYHVDKAIEMNGKICVQVNEKNNPSPTYVYYDDGEMKTMDGKKWTGDTEYSEVAGWMSEKDIQKSNVKVQNKTLEKGKNHQKVQEKDKER